MRALRLLAVTLSISGLAIAASAQQGMRHGGGTYSAGTEATLTGTVAAVTTTTASGGGGGTHFTLTAPSGAIEVHAGPASFLESKNFTIAKGDHVLRLRDANGLPVRSARSEAQTSGQQPDGPPAGSACSCCMQGMSGMHGMPGMQDMPGMQGMQNDMQVLHQLLANRNEIRRDVTNLPNGIDSVTRSADPAVAALLKEHVPAMVKRLDDGRPIHYRDPLFAEIFRHAKQIKVTVEPLADGVHVVETSDDPYVARLIQEHAGVVNLFLERGMSEMHRDHALPQQR